MDLWPDDRRRRRAVAVEVGRRGSPPTRYWEELVVGSETLVGPFVITEEQLAAFLELSHEHYPIHTDDAFAGATKMRRRVIPGTFVHSVAAGRVGETCGYTGVICVRSAHYDYLEPLHPDETFHIKHRNIPTWDEAVGMVIATNMEARAKNPNGGSRGRGRGRGRR